MRGEEVIELSANEFDTIDAFHTLDGEWHTIREVSDRIGIKYNSADRRMQYMTKRGLIERRHKGYGRDCRASEVRVTQLGHELFQVELDAMVQVAA